MAADGRAKIVIELAAEFVEERVRQLPTEPFKMEDMTRALGTLLRDAGNTVELRAGDDRWLSDWLDQHPFLLRLKAGSTVAWRPGLNKGH